MEFRPRGSFEPVTDMIGGGPFQMQAGQWTDDTAMALCLASSLVACNGFDPHDQMQRYCRWEEEGYLSSTGSCFDIGNTIKAALDYFRRTGDPFAGSNHPHSAGNGSIMRLAPIAMFCFPDLDAAEHYGAESSRTTHAAPECLDACRLFARIISRALIGMPEEEIAFGDSNTFTGSEKIAAIARGEYRNKAEADIHGSGYVVKSLEAAMWCFVHTNNFKDAVLMAANLGDDADTTAAVCGQVAGAYYGESQIPVEWLEKLALRQEITNLADRLYEI